MSQPKKFKTFSGVFVPSLLTIVGAIMYLRLGWIVGVSGLTYSILIVALSYLIALTTGLCLSSIATDKKIQKDGIYYMLSRSLGLPMGGAISIAIILALVFNTALQIIGLSESILNIPEICSALNLSPDAFSYRLLGSAILVILFIIVIICDTSAFKIQYLVFTAIILSLLSIIVGIITNTYIRPNFTNTPATIQTVPWIYLFAIFFPAATGFTTGLAFTNALVNPKKSIPTGIVLAILTSLIIYLLVVVGFHYFVKPDILTGNVNFLPTISLNSTITIIGIWSSILFIIIGSLIIAPKILLSIAKDKILPDFTTYTTSRKNIPIVSSLAVFILAEGAVLIGDFNTIAHLSTLCLLAAYALINLALMLEKWTNPDFRPSFNVSKYVGLIGFMACIITMYEINPIGLAIAIILLTSLYFLIRRRKLQMEYGDVWQNVLLSITRNSLKIINKRKLENRNWQPNIIVFSGGSSKRPYLVDFAKWIVGKHGFLSNFNMITTSKEKFISLKNTTSIIGDNSKQWVETKLFPCKDVYSGIETVASTYGFTGIEPNTVILGFNSTAKDSDRYIAMLANITKLDKNILLVHFNDDKGFGNKKIIDVWIIPGEKDSLFALDIVKLLWNSVEWSQSLLRVNVVNSNNSAYNIVYNKIDEILNQLRISGEIRVINNELENKPVKDLIVSHSSDSELIFLAIPASDNNIEKYNMMENLSQIDNTLVFVKSSTQFQSIGNLDIITKQLLQNQTSTPKIIDSNVLLPLRPEAATYFKVLDDAIQLNVNKSVITRFEIISSYFKTNYDFISKTIANNYTATDNPNVIRHSCNIACKSIKQKLLDFSTTILPDIKKLLLDLNIELLDATTEICNSIPKTFTVFYEENLAYPSDDDSPEISSFKKKIARYFKHKNSDLFPYEVQINKFIEVEIQSLYNSILAEFFNYFKNYCITYYYSLNDVIDSIDDTNTILQSNCSKPDFQFAIAVDNIFNHIKSANEKKSDSDFVSTLNTLKNNHLENIRAYFDTLNFGELLPNKDLLTISNKNALKNSDDKINYLCSLLPNLYNRILLNIDLAIFKTKLTSFSTETASIASDFINKKIIPYHKSFITNINNNVSLDVIDITHSADYDINAEMFSLFSEITDKLTKSIQHLPGRIHILDNQSLSILASDNIYSVIPSDFNASRLLDYTIQYNYSNKIKKLLNSINLSANLSIDKHKDVITQLSFSNDNNVVATDSITNTLKEEIISLEKNSAKLIDEIFSTTILTEEKLKLDAFIASYSLLRNTINTTEREQTKIKILILHQRIISFFRSQLTNLWYRQSAGIIMTKKLRDRNNDNEHFKTFINSLSKISLQNEVDQSLPYSYKQLFINTQQYNKDLWVGRSKEVTDFRILLTQYNSVKSGAIMVSGEIGSGKTFFCYHVARTFFPKQQIFTIKSVTGGSSSVKKFEASFLRAVDMQNISLYNAIKELPKGSIFILDNIEQWWHRGDHGNDVIDSIINMINKYSSNYLFILNSNTEGCHTLQITTQIQNILVGIINILPFNAEELESIILRRHRIGNMKINLNNKNEKFIRPWNYAKLFTQYYKLTNGNIKSALSAWIACIHKVDDDTIYIHEPIKPELLPLHQLTKQQIIFLVQFIIHNNMSYERIHAIWKLPIAEITQNLNVLLRLRLIEHKSENVYGVNTILYPFILNELKKIEMM